MNDNEYHQKLKFCKTDEERFELNDEFLKSKVKANKLNKFKKYCKDNAFTIFNTIIAFIALIVAILSLLLQLQ